MHPLELDGPELAALLSMIGLVSAMMENDRETFEHFFTALRQDPMPMLCGQVIQKISALGSAATERSVDE